MYDIAYIIERIISFFVGLVVLILGLRVVFLLFDANPAAGFVEWIYRTSDTLMGPFRGIFPPATFERGITLDVSALFAILAYIIIGYLLISLVSMVPEPRTDRTWRRVVRK